MTITDRPATDTLDKLQELSRNFPSLTDLVINGNHADGTNANPAFIHYATESGECFGFRLWAQAEVSVQRSFMTAGATMPDHVHRVHEWLIVYRGCLVVYFKDQGPVSVGVAHSIVVPPHTVHRITAEENTWMIAITIPPAKGYPAPGVGTLSPTVAFSPSVERTSDA